MSDEKAMGLIPAARALAEVAAGTRFYPDAESVPENVRDTMHLHERALLDFADAIVAASFDAVRHAESPRRRSFSVRVVDAFKAAARSWTWDQPR